MPNSPGSVCEGWRVPEKALHAAAVLGAAPGSLVAMELLRHKTRKQPFRTVRPGIFGGDERGAAKFLDRFADPALHGIQRLLVPHRQLVDAG